MKRVAALLLILLLTLPSCAGRTAQKPSATDGTAADATQTGGVPERTSTTDPAMPVRVLPDTDLSGRTADVDLTALDTQMAYVQLSNMMLSPEEYRGKTVKMRGTFAHAEEADREFFVCYLMDATACCSQSLEFVTDDAFDFPAGYPATESGITVFGVFDTYKYNGYAMYRLVHAEVDY